MNTDDRNTFPLGCCPVKQDPPPLLTSQDRVEKLATGKSTSTKARRMITVTEKLKIARDRLIVGTWNVQILWATGRLVLLKNEMRRFKYDILGVSELCWTGKGETPDRAFIWSGENNTHLRDVGILVSEIVRKLLVGYNLVSLRVITARFNGATYKITAIHA